ncbi:MAG: glycosyltransferase [Candidatus Omnitrophica bacterium]|nr:glycosyltransferase [Candidatus Omnitrophota bacterium]
MEKNRLIELSVVIPTYNRKKFLKECVNSLLNQDYPAEKYEIIVVDDGSSDGTDLMMASFTESHPNIEYLQREHQGPAAARNAGIKHSSGQIIALTDNDCLPAKNWVGSILRSHKLHNEALAVGGLTEVSPRNIKALVSQSLSNGAMSVEIKNKKELIFFPTCNVSFKKEYLFENFNELFPLPAGEDLEFFWRIFKGGSKFVYDEKIGVFHNCHPNFRSFLKQAYMYGKGNFLVQHLHKDHPLLKEILPQSFCAFVLGTTVNFLKIPRFSYLLGSSLIASGLNLNGYEKFQVYFYFTLHKIMYLAGNIAEFTRVERLNKENEIIKKPKLLILDITHECNLKCRICDIWKTSSSEINLDFRYIRKLLFEARELKIKEIALSGGEPLLRNDIFEIFDYAKKIGLKNIGILTNGMLVERHLEKLKPYLITGFVSPVISFDSLNPQLHNHIRNNGLAWQMTKKALNMLASLKKEHPKTNFNVITIILGQNLEELQELAVFVKSLNANSLQFQPLLANNLDMAERKSSPFWVPRDRLLVLDSVIDGLIGLKRKDPRFIKNSERNLSLIKKYYRQTLTYFDASCLSADKTVLVANQGDFRTCFSGYGDIKSQGLKQVLQGKKIIQVRQKARKCSSPCLLPCFFD